MLSPLKSVILLVAIAFPFASAPGEIVINEIYGGGGNSGAPFNQDFIELFNNGTDPVDISGFLLKYGRPGRSLKAIAKIPGSTILGAGEFYIIGGANGATGAALPHADFTTLTNLNATEGKIKLLDSSSVRLDVVDYSMTATQDDDHRHRRASVRLETTAIFSPKNALSDQRVPNGIDTNNNNLDFQAHLPTPDALNVAAVPEPSTWMMLSLGAVGLAGMEKLRRRR